MKFSQKLFLVFVLLILTSKSTIINLANNPNVTTIYWTPAKYVTVTYDYGDVQIDSSEMQPLRCAIGSQLMDTNFENDFYSKIEDKLVVDPVKLQADCIGVIPLPGSSIKGQFWLLFAPRNDKVAYYDSDHPRWQSTWEQIMERYRLTGRLTRAQTDNTQPVDKLISDGEGNFYRIQQTFWSEKKQVKTLYIEEFFMNITVTQVGAI